jgi:regulator of protease activity HflC (stomatin/prohibitin superfamily)
MGPAVWIALLVGAVITVFVVWLVLIETSIRVDPGTLVLLLKRGKATGRALEPGRHFIQPWRKVMVQVYPSRELALLAGGAGTGDTRVDAVDEPLRVHLGDKTFARLSYTVRCQLDTGTLKHVHEQFGPEGIWAALRDTVRRTLLVEAGRDEMSVDDAFGARFTAFEQRCSKELHTALAAIGFELTMFSLREIDLGETGEVIQSTLRADAELAREQAFARVRTARLENDAEMRGLAGDVGDELLLRYRQIEAWRDLLERWDGDRPIPAALTAPLRAASPPAAEVGAPADHHAAEVEQESPRTDTP